ncbi:MAG: hypothetical protein OK422_04390 [Thaumarchaeota archaeon]|nr:hypothetical protein [Nitrososphaerota archaeon]
MPAKMEKRRTNKPAAVGTADTGSIEATLREAERFPIDEEYRHLHNNHVGHEVWHFTGKRHDPDGTVVRDGILVQSCLTCRTVIAMIPLGMREWMALDAVLAEEELERMGYQP